MARHGLVLRSIHVVSELGQDLEQVTDHSEVSEFEDRGLGVLVLHHHDGLGGAHSRAVLDGAGDDCGEVQLGGPACRSAPLGWLAGTSLRPRPRGRRPRRTEAVRQALEDGEPLSRALPSALADNGVCPSGEVGMAPVLPWQPRQYGGGVHRCTVANVDPHRVRDDLGRLGSRDVGPD
jgi:hypothetical protein